MSQIVEPHALGHSEKGRSRKTIYGKTKREVIDKLTRLKGQLLDGVPVHRQKMTVAEWVDRWMGGQHGLSASSALR